jgi:glycosyltransferase involved in cell wall biosynthesis
LIILEPTRHTHPNEQRIAVVIPAFNEGGRVGHVVEAIPREIVDDIIVVDDHSTDATAEESIKNGATHVASSASRGVGAAIKTGYWEALKRGADVLVVVAGDGQHDPREIPRILEPVLSGNADYAVGDRLNASMHETDMTTFRYVGNRMLSLLTRMLTGLEVKDSQCGFTAITREALEKLDLQWITNTWGVPNDFLFECASQRLRVKYVKVKAYRGERRSYIRIHSYIPRMVFVLLRGRVRLVRSRRKSVKKEVRGLGPSREESVLSYAS